MFNRIATAIRSLRRGQWQTIEQSDGTSVSPRIYEREGIAAGLSLYRKPSPPHDPSHVVVFVPDITQSSRETWTTDEDQFWPEGSLKDFHIFTFDYNSGFANSVDAILQYDAIRMNALRLLSELQKMKRQSGDVFSPVFIAHGYGGLICEQAYLFSLQAPQWHGLVQIDGLILFGTPHFPAGLAQWALISAKKLGIACEDSRQEQDWSEGTLDENLQLIAEMQKEFRDLDTELKMACYFSLLPVPHSKLEISPQWTILPGVKAIALNAHHFGMTKVNEPQHRQIVELPCRISQETLERRWVESSQKYHGQEASQVSNKTAKVKGDKIFSPEPNEGNKNSDEEGKQILSRERSRMSFEGDTDQVTLEQSYGIGTIRLCNSIVNQIHKEGMTNDITWLNSMLGGTPTPAILDAALKSQNGIETLRTLFVLRGDQITISHSQIQRAIHKTSSRTDVLELILLLRGDQGSVTGMSDILRDEISGGEIDLTFIQMILDRYIDKFSIFDMRDIFKTAAYNKKNGLRVIQMLLDRYVDQISITGIETILVAAATNQEDGVTIMRLVLERLGNQVPVTDLGRIFKRAAVNKKDAVVILQTLLDRYGHMSVANVNDIMQVAAANEGSGAAAVKLVLSRYGDRLELTEGVAKAAASNSPLNMRLEVSMILLQAATKRDESYTAFARLLVEPHARSPPGRLEERFSWEMLSWAATKKDMQVCKLLLDSGQIDDDFKTFEDGSWTPLLYAIYKEARFKEGKDMIKALVTTGHINKSNVEAKRKGQPALSYAAEMGLDDVVTQLLRIEGIRVNVRDEWDRTPLFFAASEGRNQVVEILLDKGKADVNARNYKGETPLFYAARQRKEEVVKILLDKGEADVNAKSRDGETAYWQAKMRNHEGIMQLLREKGAVDNIGV